MQPSRRLFLAAGAASLATTLVAKAANAHTWANPGAAPFATSKEVAMAAREKVFTDSRYFGLPKEVADYFMTATLKEGIWRQVQAKEHFDVMMSKGFVALKPMEVPDIDKTQIYAKYPIVQEWSYWYQGKRYVVVLPNICFNWSLRIEQGHCAELSFRAPIGANIRFAVGSLDGPFPPNDCDAVRQGNGPWEAWSGQCDTCSWYNVKYLREELYHNQGAQWYHKTMYRATDIHQTLRFPREVMKKVVVICMDYTDAQGRYFTTDGIYVTWNEWNGQPFFDIPDGNVMWHQH